MAIATELQRGSYFIYNGEPARVLRKEVVVYGTHSHSKLKIFFQVLNEKVERNANFHHTDKVEIIGIVRKLGQVISKSAGKAQVMDMVSFETFDSTASPEIFEELKEGDNVTFIELNGMVQIIEKREG